MKLGITAEVLVLALALLFALPAQAQHGKPQHNGGRQQHGQQQERHVDRGHGRNEGRSIDSRYRNENFGRDHHRRLYDVLYGRPTFEFGGIWFGLEVWPSYWLASDFVYVEYVDGDYFLVNERYPDARVAIIIE